MNLKQTKWYRWVKNNYPSIFYTELLELAQMPSLVCRIIQWNPGDIGNITDEVFWAITVVKPDNHYGTTLYESKTEKEALDLCKEMNWRLEEN